MFFFTKLLGKRTNNKRLGKTTSLKKSTLDVKMSDMLCFLKIVFYK